MATLFELADKVTPKTKKIVIGIVLFGTFLVTQPDQQPIHKPNVPNISAPITTPKPPSIASVNTSQSTITPPLSSPNGMPSSTSNLNGTIQPALNNQTTPLTSSSLSQNNFFIQRWKAESDGNPKTYLVDDMKISLYSSYDHIPVPQMRIEAPGMEMKTFSGQAGSEKVMASFAVAKIDPGAIGSQIFFLTYSGGAHCCTQIKIFERDGITWKEFNLGNYDGSFKLELAKDIDGDGIPDIVLHDDAFNYQFASYADSYAPPKIFNLVNGLLLDVTAFPRYEALFRQEMATNQNECLRHSNGACAAFVATAARLGLYDWAWDIMMSNYDKTSTWGLEGECTTEKVNYICPPGKAGPSVIFPEALNKFLSNHNYISEKSKKSADIPPPLGTNNSTSPSFNCEKVQSQVLLLVCATPSLSEADQQLAAAYSAALTSTSDLEKIRHDEIEWISIRNNSEANVAQLLELYHKRIAELQSAGNTDAASHGASNP